MLYVFQDFNNSDVFLGLLANWGPEIAIFTEALRGFYVGRSVVTGS
jgi:hypothetical protein